MTKQEWYDHLRKTIDISTSCKTNGISCSDCINRFGPCRKNVAILKFNQLIEELRED